MTLVRPGAAAAGAGGDAGAVAPEPGLDGEGVAVEGDAGAKRDVVVGAVEVETGCGRGTAR